MPNIVCTALRIMKAGRGGKTQAASPHITAFCFTLSAVTYTMHGKQHQVRQPVQFSSLPSMYNVPTLVEGIYFPSM